MVMLRKASSASILGKGARLDERAGGRLVADIRHSLKPANQKKSQVRKPNSGNRMPPDQSR